MTTPIKNGTKRTVLLVGGAGYIGTVLSDHFLRHGYQVRVFDRLIYDNQTVLPLFLGQAGFDFRYGDIARAGEIEKVLEGVSDIVFLAGLVGDPITRKFPDAAHRINEMGYEISLGALNGRSIDRVIFVSTCSNYGLVPDDTLADEKTALQPLSPYAQAKVKIEQKIMSAVRDVDYVPTILRFATAFGISPRMRFDLTISEFTRELYLNKGLLVYDPDTWRPYCHVRDFARVVQSVLEAPSARVAGEVFNAGGDVNNFTKRMIVESIRRRLPASGVKFQDHGSDPRNYRVNFNKIRDRLGFVPAYTVENGIDELLTALKQGLFHDIATPPRFFGNHDIDYDANSDARGGAAS